MPQIFAKRLLEIRGTQTRAAFAKQVEISEGAIRSYENGTIPSLEVALRIAVVGNVSLDWLIGRDGFGPTLFKDDHIEMDENVAKTIDKAVELLHRIADRSKRILMAPDDLSQTFRELLTYAVQQDASVEKMDNILDFETKKKRSR